MTVEASPYRVTWSGSAISVASSNTKFDGEELRELLTHHCEDGISPECNEQEDFDCGRWKKYLSVLFLDASTHLSL